MPIVFVEFNSFNPDGGDHGDTLALARNVIPIHSSYRLVQKKLIIATVVGTAVTGAFAHIWLQQSAVQKGRPDSDTTPGNYLASSGTILFSMINEVTPVDSSYIFVGNAPSASVAKVSLSDLVSPGGSTSHYIRFRYRIPATSGSWTLKIELVEGTTVRATKTVTGSSTNTIFTAVEYNLTGGEAGAISDYTNLFVQITSTVPGSLQFSRPSADLSIDGWVTEISGNSNIYQSIDESSASDTDYIRSPALVLGGATRTYAGQLSAHTDPVIKAGYTFRYRFKALNAGVIGAIRFKCGTVIVHSVALSSISTSFTAGSFTLSSTEVDLLITRTDLRIDIDSSYPSSVTSTVSQFGRPTGDDSNTSFSASHGGALYVEIDESTLDETDYIYTGTAGPGESIIANCLLSINSVSDPLVSVGHKIFARAYLPTTERIRMSLYQGTTLIAFQDLVGISGITNYSYTLTSTETDSITSYSTLKIKFELTTSGGGIFIYQAYFECPEVRALAVSFVELECPSTSRAEVSWFEYEAPDPTAVYKGDQLTIFAATETKIYSVDQSGFTDVTGASYGSGSPKPGGNYFSSYGNNIVVTNRKDPVRYRADNTGNFVDLMTSTAKPKFRFAMVVRQFLVGLDVSLSGDTYDSPDAFWWSAFDNIRSFDRTPATQCGAGFCRSTNGGIMGGVGGDDGLIFKRNSTYALTWQNSSIPFRLDAISVCHGTPYPRSIVKTPYGTYFWGGDTFYRIQSTGAGSFGYPEDVGAPVISRYLSDYAFSDGAILQKQYTSIAIEDQAMIGWYDQSCGLIFWQYEAVTYDDGSGTKTPSDYRHHSILVHNPRTEEWAIIRDSSLDLSICINLPNTNSSATSILKGTTGFSWDGTNVTWFKFQDNNTYSARFETKRRAIAMDDQKVPMNVRVTGIQPIFSYAPGTSVIPNLSVTVQCGNDPYYVTRTDVDSTVISPISKTVVMTDADSFGWYHPDVTGRWFKFSLVVPELMLQTIFAFRGMYIQYEMRGTG